MTKTQHEENCRELKCGHTYEEHKDLRQELDVDLEKRTVGRIGEPGHVGGAVRVQPVVRGPGGVEEPVALRRKRSRRAGERLLRDTGTGQHDQQSGAR